MKAHSLGNHFRVHTLAAFGKDFSKGDCEFNFGFVNSIIEKILQQGLDALAYATQQFTPPREIPYEQTDILEKSIQVNKEIFVSLIATGSHKGSVAYNLASNVSFLAIISQLSNELTMEREQWKTQKKNLIQVIKNHSQDLIEKEEEVE